MEKYKKISGKMMKTIIVEKVELDGAEQPREAGTGAEQSN